MPSPGEQARDTQNMRRDYCDERQPFDRTTSPVPADSVAARTKPSRDQRECIFQPFQRLGDDQAGTGVGLGLAVARGFLAAMGGTIKIDDTPGGGRRC